MWSYKQNKLLAIFLSVTVCKPNVEQFVDPWNRSVVCDNECGVFSVPEAARDDLRTRTMQIRQRHIKCARIEQKRPRKTKLIEISRHRVPRAAQNPVYPWDTLWDKLPGKISVFHRFFNLYFLHGTRRRTQWVAMTWIYVKYGWFRFLCIRKIKKKLIILSRLTILINLFQCLSVNYAN